MTSAEDNSRHLFAQTRTGSGKDGRAGNGSAKGEASHMAAKPAAKTSATKSATGKSVSTRGFASMDRDKQREIASKGGQSVPDEKRSFSRNRELAAAAGRKGGRSVPDEKRSFSRNPALAAEAGRKGGQVQGGGQVSPDHQSANGRNDHPQSGQHDE